MQCAWYTLHMAPYLYDVCYQFKAISQAYQVLSDPTKRDLYDRGGEEVINEGGTGGGGGFQSPMDIFQMFFGGGGGGHHHGSPKCKDTVHQMSVSLENLYNGVVRKLTLPRDIICPECDGENTSNFPY